MSSSLSSSEVKTGKVKFWHEEKGYGFIIEDKTGDEFYTYKKKLDPSHSRLFNENKVEFEIEEYAGRDKDQTHAINVRIV